MLTPVGSIALLIPFQEASMLYFCLAVSGSRGSTLAGGAGSFSARFEPGCVRPEASLPNSQPILLFYLLFRWRTHHVHNSSGWTELDFKRTAFRLVWHLRLRNRHWLSVIGNKHLDSSIGWFLKQKLILFATFWNFKHTLNIKNVIKYSRVRCTN